MLDRVVGYQLSPLLWRRFATGKLSAGRVQSAALKMIVDRAREAADHVPEAFWTMEATFSMNKGPSQLEAKAYSGAELAKWTDPAALVADLRAIGAIKAWKATFTQKPARRNPPAPFATSSLQQEAYALHKFSAKRTMQLAQGLYEAGHITYMRTDSLHISAEAKADIAGFVQATYGREAHEARDYKTKAAGAQEAHEAIRPTDPSVTEAGETPAHAKLYKLIWSRAVASQMVAAGYIDVVYTIEPNNKKTTKTTFKGKHSFLVSPGYLALYDEAPQAAVVPENAPVTPAAFECPGSLTHPPPYYNEATLVKVLEAAGVGRPSTYATIIDKLFDKAYALKGTPPQKTVATTHYKYGAGDVTEESAVVVLGSNDRDRMIPTSLGERVVEYLDEVVPYLLEATFTAKMEADLDLISHGKKKATMLKAFYRRFRESVDAAVEASEAVREEKKRVEAECRAKAKAEGVKPREAAKACRPQKPTAPAAPKNVLREFDGAAVVQTRFGPALFVPATEADGKGRFVSVAPFLKWRDLTLEDMSQADVDFLVALPIKRRDGSEVVMGRYGLYAKTADGKSLRMTAEEQEAAFRSR
jgi:DNA topoisomerase-1